MKHLKMLGLAAIAVAALMAFLGAGTASATVICKNNLSTEKCSEPYLKGTVGTASAEDSIKVTGPFSLLIDTCAESTVTGTQNNNGGPTEAVTSTLTSLTFGKCTRPTTVVSPGTGSLQWIAGTDNGTLTTSGTTVVIHEIPGFGTCAYVTSNTKIGTATGGNPGTLDLSATIPSETSGCPSGTLSGHYVATSPTAAWVTSG
ncbi:MAG TPA: hypothetical protein VLC07_08510 [Solirubrobacterales bacterium]|nr:hypothetical protein [Solirubrobacterales bacterium]